MWFVACRRRLNFVTSQTWRTALRRGGGSKLPGRIARAGWQSCSCRLRSLTVCGAIRLVPGATFAGVRGVSVGECSPDLVHFEFGALAVGRMHL